MELSRTRHPEKFEKIAVHVLWIYSFFSERIEKRAISREVAYVVSTEFARRYRVEEVPKIVVEWGEEDKAILDLKKNMLLVVLRRGRKHRYDNIAKAILKAIPELLAPEMKIVYDSRFVDCLSAHVARSLVKDYPPIVAAINDFIASRTEEDPGFSNVSSMLIEVDDQSLLSRILLPELVDVARLRYPHRDPQIDSEVLSLLEILYNMVKGKDFNPVICGNYFKMTFVLVARPEKIKAMLEPHIQFVKHSLRRCPTIETIYILAAGRNIAAAKALETPLTKELGSMGFRLKSKDGQEYEAKYKGKPHMKLYVCRIKIGRIGGG